MSKQGLPIGSGVLSCRSFLMKSTRFLLRRKISCFRPAQAGGGGGDLGGGRFGGGRLGAVFFGVGLGVGLGVGAVQDRSAMVSSQRQVYVISVRDLRGLSWFGQGDSSAALLQRAVAAAKASGED